jgi:hypothetical protein
MLNRIRPFLLASLALAFVGQHVAAQNADEAISEEDVTAEQASGASQDASDAEAQAAAIAQKLSNPVASLISVPIQINYDDNYGLNDKGSVWRTNVQPVIPISLNDDWNMISRTIVPVRQTVRRANPGREREWDGRYCAERVFLAQKAYRWRFDLGRWTGH